MRPTITGIQLRQVTIEDIETRAANADGSIPFRGHAATFNRWTVIGGYFRERIMPGAFRKTIGEADVRFLHNHNPMMVLARNKAGTLKLSEDTRGLLVEADMAPTTYAQDLAISMERGDVNEMSFAFQAVREEWDETKKLPERSVIEARLFDVSTVTYPAYSGTDAALRNAEYGALIEALGLSEMDEAQRSALLLQVHEGDIAPEFAPVLRAAQERLASLVPGAGHVPPSGEGVAPPNGTLTPGNVEQFRIRMRMRELAQRIA